MERAFTLIFDKVSLKRNLHYDTQVILSMVMLTPGMKNEKCCKHSIIGSSIGRCKEMDSAGCFHDRGGK